MGELSKKTKVINVLFEAMMDTIQECESLQNKTKSHQKEYSSWSSITSIFKIFSGLSPVPNGRQNVGASQICSTRKGVSGGDARSCEALVGRVLPQQQLHLAAGLRPGHKAKVTQAWCKEELAGFWPAHMWPPSSPDCAPLDYGIWGFIESKACQTLHRSVDAMKAKVEEVWVAMDPAYVTKVCRAFRPRLKAMGFPGKVLAATDQVRTLRSENIHEKKAVIAALVPEYMGQMESPKLLRREDVSRSPEPEVLGLNFSALGVPDSPEPVRRASSLRSGKTPPRTPGERKIVRFADVFGLDLIDVKTFLDEVPKVPKCAFRYLTNVELSDIESENGSVESTGQSAKKFHTLPPIPPRQPTTTLVPMFTQPGSFSNFFDLLKVKKVCLENAFTAHRAAIQGTIRVRNISFQKTVGVRYSYNDWQTSVDIAARYLNDSCDGISDKFTFYILLPAPLYAGHKLQFCIRYQTDTEEFWDNNDGGNYVFQCLGVAGTGQGGSSASRTLPVPTPKVARYCSGDNYSQSPCTMAAVDPWMRFA
eukprot:maker-scaffold747_size103044-snap-gene-0.19 protein:Tk12103 transcript:maker-scaffold747_size103044-snap-gene-0.19-mRNA-1 annotation:"glycogen-binding subunit 76a-like isoform x1"